MGNLHAFQFHCECKTTVKISPCFRGGELIHRIKAAVDNPKLPEFYFPLLL